MWSKTSALVAQPKKITAGRTPEPVDEVEHAGVPGTADVAVVGGALVACERDVGPAPPASRASADRSVAATGSIEPTGGGPWVLTSNTTTARPERPTPTTRGIGSPVDAAGTCS